MYNTNLDKLTDYPFDRLRALLNGVEAPVDKEPMIMSLGEPKHASPALLTETINKFANQWAKYPPIAGTPDLLDAIREWLNRRYNLPAGLIEASQNICAVSGTREALYMAGDIAISPQKNGARPVVLIPNPFYQVYIGAALMNRAEPIYMSATPENGFLPDFAALDEATLQRTALAFLCSPSNPQGAVADLDYLKTAITLARKYDFVLAVDECYAEIYDQSPPPGGLEACQDLGGDQKNNMANVLVFHSLSKRSNAPGLRSGFVAGDPELIKKFKTLRNYGGATLPIPILAASAALWHDDDHVQENRKLYRQKFDRADQILGEQFGHYRPEGGFYLWLDVIDGETAARRLWMEAGVRVMPGGYLARPDASGFNPGTPYIRIALVQKLEFISEALGRVVETLK